MYTVMEINTGFLAMSPKPDGGAELAGALAHLKSSGVTGLVSLLEVCEARELALSMESNECRLQGLRFDHYPIADFGVPVDALSFHTLVSGVADRVAAGEGVLVHCRGGIGRSGLLAIAVLCCFGHQLDSAIQQCTRVRGVSVPETAEQIAWLAL